MFIHKPQFSAGTFSFGFMYRDTRCHKTSEARWKVCTTLDHMQQFLCTLIKKAIINTEFNHWNHMQIWLPLNYEETTAKSVTISINTTLPTMQLNHLQLGQRFRCVALVAAKVMSCRDEERAVEVRFSHFFQLHPDSSDVTWGTTTGFIQLSLCSCRSVLKTCKQTLVWKMGGAPL